jgi:hypothetical protein
MRGVSYLAIGEWTRTNGTVLVEHRFFTNRRVRTESPKLIAEADKWAASKLREHGTDNCRVTVAKVLWTISG